MFLNNELWITDAHDTIKNALLRYKALVCPCKVKRGIRERALDFVLDEVSEASEATTHVANPLELLLKR
ncbi:hypothetical protein [Vibrio harveyi]|uniref:hypothetical protein n=1 Tax=Vibrio harveyi TaxID=669 RepID=UPI0011AF6214|nr:hypothetical protein [Vibrio harveyi]